MNTLSPVLDITEHYLPLDISEVFGNKRETALEIGFGEGDFLIDMAKRHPDRNFIGIEIKRKRFKKAVKRTEREGLQNIRLLQMDAKIAVEEVFYPNTFHEVYINFPDPWPKDRHKKHRIINPVFLETLANIMKPEAVLEVASDHEEYIFNILETFSETELFESKLPPPGYVYNLPNRPPTKFEREFRAEGKDIYYLRVTRITKVNSTIS